MKCKVGGLQTTTEKWKIRANRKQLFKTLNGLKYQILSTVINQLNFFKRAYEKG